MFKDFKGLYNDESGNYFVDMALALIIVSLVVASYATTLTSTGIAPKYTGITTELSGVSVPDLTP